MYICLSLYLLLHWLGSFPLLFKPCGDVVLWLSFLLLGDKPDVGPCSVENVAERDLLRTEGDPAALGYTIHEAVALTRSMVSLQPLS